MMQPLPVFALLLSATIWGVIWYPLRLLEAGGMAGLWQALISYVAALLVLLPFMRGLGACWRGHRGHLLLLALLSGWCNVAFVLAMLEGTVIRVLLLFYLSPVWAVLLARLWLGETLSRAAVGVLVIGMGGTLLMLWDPAIGLPIPRDRADWLALTAGMTFAAMNVTLRHLQQVSLVHKAFYTWVGVVLVSAAGLLLMAEPLPDASPPIWGGTVLLGLAGFLVATFSVQYGVTRLPVQRSAVILLFELVAGGISSALLAGEVTSPLEWAGGSLIVLAGYWAAVRAEPEMASDNGGNEQ